MNDFEDRLAPGTATQAMSVSGTGRVWHGDLLLAESTECLALLRDGHKRLCFPYDDVDWTRLDPTVEGWTLTGTDVGVVAWAHPDTGESRPNHVRFDDARLRVELEERWADADPPEVATTRFPPWGDLEDLIALMDPQPSERDAYTAPAFPSAAGHPVEGGHQLGQAIVAAAKALPDKQVASAHSVFSRMARFDDPIELSVEILHEGRSTSTVEVRSLQDDRLRTTTVVSLATPSEDVYSTVALMPDVPGPLDAQALDWQVPGREIRVVDGAYDENPDRTGPPEIFIWTRYRRSPAERHLRQALLAQYTTHWVVAASMRPHRGFSIGTGKFRSDDPHDSTAPAAPSLTTAPLASTIAFHDDVDVSDWLLFANPAIYAGRGHCQGEGRVYTRDGRLVASYSTHALARLFEQTT